MAVRKLSVLLYLLSLINSFLDERFWCVDTASITVGKQGAFHGLCSLSAPDGIKYGQYAWLKK